MPTDTRTPAERLAEANAVLSLEEQAVMVAVCGKTQSLRAACRETGMGRRKLERVLKTALDKLTTLDAITTSGKSVGSTSAH